MPERLKELREQRGLNKAEAARLLDLSKMGYLRYESAERTPSYQTIVFMAQKLGTSPDYLTGITDDPAPQEYRITRTSEPVLFRIVEALISADPEKQKRLLAYCRKLTERPDQFPPSGRQERQSEEG